MRCFLPWQMIPKDQVESKAIKEGEEEGKMGVLGMDDHYAECYPG